ncbi:hypothetical protein [Sphingomonas paucimobilis]|uniref:hypothetical protein n=1 Tax=Sphingomonas paucimobilis TaxID=13689 RepID=UPI001E288868|nr:hypothetical protein [Sphingomonas paucimobilis]
MLSGLATGFENVSLTGKALTVTGVLGSNGAPLGFGDGDTSLTIAKSATLAGVIDLGAGNDALRLSAGSILQATVAGGAGNDSATLELAGNQTLAAGTLTGFETLASEGTGTLSLAGTQAYNQVNAATDLTIAAGSSLTAGRLPSPAAISASPSPAPSQVRSMAGPAPTRSRCRAGRPLHRSPSPTSPMSRRWR